MSVDSVQTPANTGAVRLTPEVRDGYEVHQAGLRRGLNVVLYPRQVLMLSAPGDHRELAFIHGIPESSTLGSVTFVQDKRMRRSLLDRVGLPVPKGATFSIGRGLKDAQNFIARIGYPVVVKPAMGDNAIETFTGLENEEQFDAAIDYLRTPPTEREKFTRAAYALTELREPGEEEGRVVVPPGYRFLIEQHVRGQYVRLLVLGDTVHSAIVCPGTPSDTVGQPGRDITEEAHPTLRQLAVDAVKALPGITVAAVDIVVADPLQPVDVQEPKIVEVSERPWLSVQADISEEMSGELGDAILAQHAGTAGITLNDPQEAVAVEFHAEAIPDLDGAVSALSDAARTLGLTGHIGVTDRVEGILDGVFQGPARDVAWIAEALLDGQLDGHRAMLVEERHVTQQAVDGFTVRS